MPRLIEKLCMVGSIFDLTFLRFIFVVDFFFFFFFFDIFIFSRFLRFLMILMIMMIMIIVCSRSSVVVRLVKIRQNSNWTFFLLRGIIMPIRLNFYFALAQSGQNTSYLLVLNFISDNNSIIVH